MDNDDTGMVLRAVEAEIRKQLSQLDTPFFSMSQDKLDQIRRLAIALRYELSGDGWSSPKWISSDHA